MGQNIVEKLVHDLGTIPSGQWRRPLLIAVSGLPCTGKTEVARYLARRFPLVLIETDATRLRYGLSSGPVTHEVIREAATMLLPRFASIVWDVIHLGRRDRDRVRRFAVDQDAHIEIIFTTASDDVVRERLNARLAAPEATTADGKYVITPDQFSTIAAYLEPPGSDEQVTSVDTSTGLQDEHFVPLFARLQALLV